MADKYISKDKALYFMNHNDKVVHYLSRTAENMVDRTTQALCQVISETPAEDVQPMKHGRWIPQGNDMWLCSNCKENIIYSEHESDRTEKQRYCCKCGARMDLKDGETK